ncbi:tail fiber protein, partial [Salmonella enterica subsp. enterica]|nr:tail fiber protein [Salmonella enterica subsp. enterica]
ALPVGVPIPWPSATPPTGWLKCNGAAFTASQYPKLALAYPSLTLPDLRGEFIRGWDDGRGIDSGRILLSSQADDFKKFTLKYLGPGPGSGTGTTTVFALKNDANGIYTTGISQGSNPTAEAFQVPGGAETRPRNIAFNYIVRAA